MVIATEVNQIPQDHLQVLDSPTIGLKRTKPVEEKEILKGNNNMPDVKEGTEEVFESHSIDSDSNYDLQSQMMKAESERKMK